MSVPVCQAEHTMHVVNCNKITVKVQLPLLNWVVLFLAMCFFFFAFFFCEKRPYYRHNSLITQCTR